MTGNVYMAATKNSPTLVVGTTTVTSVILTLMLDPNGNVVSVTQMPGAINGGANNFCFIDPWREF